MRSPALILLLIVSSLAGCASGPAWQRRAFAFSSPADPPVPTPQTNLLALNRVSISPLFQSRSFTYRTGENSYVQDPYAGFLIPPERALAEPIRGWLRGGGGFGRVLEPGSALSPTLVAEVSVNELYGDFRKGSPPAGTMVIHFILYAFNNDAPGHVLLDKVCSHQTPLRQKTPEALMAAWDADLREIMAEIGSEYVKANSNDRGGKPTWSANQP